MGCSAVWRWRQHRAQGGPPPKQHSMPRPHLVDKQVLSACRKGDGEGQRHQG